jgi:hypothetical protein
MTQQIPILVLSSAEEEIRAREYPVSASKSGQNTLYHHCAVYDGRSNYAVCLHTIAAVLEKRAQLRSGCPEAIQNRTCPAMRMRKNELDAGRALYYIGRPDIEALRRKQAEEDYANSPIQYRRRQGVSQPALKGTPGGRIDFSKYEADRAAAANAERTTPAKEKAKQLDADLIGGQSIQNAINATMEE